MPAIYLGRSAIIISMFIQPRSMKGCQIGQGKLSIRKTSEGIGKETEEGAEGKGKAKEKE
jgi:hypothetical protein